MKKVYRQGRSGHNWRMIKGYMLLCFVINFDGLPVNRCMVTLLPEYYSSIEQCFAAGHAAADDVKDKAPAGIVPVVTIECVGGNGA